MQKEQKNFFLKNNVEVSIIELQFKGHCEELVRNMDLSKYDVLCIIGGDGTIHEAINGLMSRNDSERNRIPIGLIPAGTGNSFVLELQGSSKFSKSAAHILRGAHTPVDILKVTCQCQHKKEDESYDGKIIYSFNSLHWGLASKVNVTAERLRWFGRATRYTTAALLEITRGEKERAKIKIVDKDGNTIEYEDEFSLAIANNIISAAKGMQMAPDAKLNDGLVDLLLVRSSNTFDLMNTFRKIYDGTHTELPYVDYLQVKSFSICPIRTGDDGHTELIEELLDIDGELKGFSPFSCEVLPLSIRVII